MDLETFLAILLGSALAMLGAVLEQRRGSREARLSQFRNRMFDAAEEIEESLSTALHAARAMIIEGVEADLLASRLEEERQAHAVFDRALDKGDLYFVPGSHAMALARRISVCLLRLERFVECNLNGVAPPFVHPATDDGLNSASEALAHAEGLAVILSTALREILLDPVGVWRSSRLGALIAPWGALRPTEAELVSLGLQSVDPDIGGSLEGRNFGSNHR